MHRFYRLQQDYIIRQHQRYLRRAAAKKTLIAVLFILAVFALFALSAQAAESVYFEAYPAGVSQMNRAQKIAYLTALAFTDYRQTVNTVVKRPGRYQELNPVLGKHPSRASLVAFGVIGVATTALIGQIDHPLARIAVDSIIATEQLNIRENEYSMHRRKSVPIMIVATFQF